MLLSIQDLSIPVTYLPEISSTNSYVKSHPELLNQQFQLVYTWHQTQGRGRDNRMWLSQQDQDISFSLVFHAKTNELTHLPLISLIASLGIQRYLRTIEPFIRIKWPNDLYYHHKKLAGILCEPILEHNMPKIIIGVGCNVNSTAWPQHITEQTTSIKTITKNPHNIEHIMISMIQSLILTLQNYTAPLLTDWYHELQDNLILPKKNISFIDENGKQTKGYVQGLSRDGYLLVRNSHITCKIDQYF